MGEGYRGADSVIMTEETKPGQKPVQATDVEVTV